MKWTRSQQTALLLKPSLAIISLLCIGMFTVGCTKTWTNNSANSTMPTTETAKVEPLRVAVIPWQSAEEQQKKLQPLTDYFQKSLNRPVKFQITKNYETAVDLLATEKVDMGYLGALSYVQCHERNPNIRPLAMPIEQKTGRPWYTGVIVAKSDQGIQSLEDLKGKRFAFVSPSSTSGFLMQMMALKKKGIEPTRDFKTIRYSLSHNKVEADLINGVVDAIAVDKLSLLRSQEAGKLPAKNYKIIWESEPIPMAPIVINTKKFSPQTVNQIRQALIDAPIGLLDMSGSQSAGYTLAQDADFDQIRQIYNELKSIEIPAK
ncbi:MAG TPA: phosphate/phosphite/phosphonate ABC transporter substrate-binding protein [Nostocaceae cyanobacterium]|nr:phosphate/phosphite/phosphonate ABC transporter substrate-binding protein [Nostocaceae cyanobacterium]